LHYATLLEKLDGYSTHIGVENLNRSLITDEDKPVTVESVKGFLGQFGAIHSTEEGLMDIANTWTEKDKRTSQVSMEKVAEFERICQNIIANRLIAFSPPSIEQDVLIRPTFSGIDFLTTHYKYKYDYKTFIYLLFYRNSVAHEPRLCVAEARLYAAHYQRNVPQFERCYVLPIMTRRSFW